MTGVASGRRYLLAVVAVPVGVLAIGLLLVAARWSALPPVVASHWSGNGVNGTQSPGGVVVTSVSIAVVLTAFLGGVGWFLPPDGRRMVAGVAAGSVGFLVTLVFGSMLAQVGLTDPYAATLSPLLFLLAAAAGVVVAGLAWMLVGRPVPVTGRRSVPPDAPGVAAEPGERLVWFGHTPSGSWVGWVCLALLVLGCVLAVTVRPWAMTGPAVGIVVILVLVHSRVVIDGTGLRVVALGLVTWLRIPLATVAHAEASELHALRDFGGFGLRYRPGGRAFVTRTGPALEIVQQDDSRTYVSLDDPDEAAAVLNTLSRRDLAR